MKISLVSTSGLISFIVGLQLKIKICNIENKNDSVNPNIIILGLFFKITAAFFIFEIISDIGLYKIKKVN